MTVIALTPGEPAGVGPDIALLHRQRRPEQALIVIADPELLERRARRLGLALRIAPWRPGEPTTPIDGVLRVLPVALAAPAIPGRLDPANADYVLETLRRAVAGCMRGEFDALTTGPIHKGALNAAGIPFSGHTDFLRAESGAPRAVMMLLHKRLRVALVTDHLPLAAVPAAITATRLEETLRILHRDLVGRFAIARPRILVAGLNPHAGEGGVLGREEIDVIAPVVARLTAEGMALEGPLPADTLFAPRQLARADALLAMYHDQGLPPLKQVGFGGAVNVTLGLPFVRTSVDHGTALELAANLERDRAALEIGSLDAALQLAFELARRDQVAKTSS